MTRIQQKNILAIDAIPFHGGSKVATAAVLAQLKDVDVTIISSHPESWCSLDGNVEALKEPAWLKRREQGLLYFVKHLWITAYILFYILRKGKEYILVGTSGPGVDLSIYIVGLLTRSPIIQLIQGPVAYSRTIARALLKSDILIYLPSTLDSIHRAIGLVRKKEGANGCLSDITTIPLLNGITKEAWPSGSSNNFNELHVFWAASLLKWKGLDTLKTALNSFSASLTPQATICYIKPRDIGLNSSEPPENIVNSRCFEEPSNLDKLRAEANVFVSTSQKEPFGLSILEAMAAGLCVVIPRDGAFWDCALQENIHCIKYIPDDAADLRQKLEYLQENMHVARSISNESKAIANQYRAELTYLPVVRAFNNLFDKEPDCSTTPCA